MQGKEKRQLLRPFLMRMLAALVFVLIAAVVLLYTQLTQRQLEEYASYTVEQASRRVTGEVDAYFSAAITSIQLTAHHTEHIMTGPTLENAPEVLRPLLADTPFNFIEYIAKDGTNLTEQGERFDASDRVYYLEGIAGNTGVWINYHPRYSSEFLLNFYTPLRYQDEIAGVLTGTLGAKTNVLPLLTSSFFGEDMIGILCDKDGSVISATFDVAPSATLTDVLNSYGISPEGQQIFADHIAKRDQSVIRFQSSEGPSLACVTIDQRTGWIILEVVPAAAFKAVMRKTSGLAYGTLVIVMVLILTYVAYLIVDARRKSTSLLREKEAEVAEQSALARVDKLTGLSNRRDYEDDMMTYPDVPTEPDFVYVSCDVSGLKVTNDTLGHAAGDELLVGAADCLTQCLGGYGKVYRVGGDEFVAMLFADEGRLAHIRRDLEETVTGWRGSIVPELALACGFVTKREYPTLTVSAMAKIADDRMYKDKAAYYMRKGVDRRGQQTAYAALCASYAKILRVNLTSDSYHIICMDDEEKTSEKGFSPSFSAWVYNFGASGQVHPDDLPDYLARTSLSFLTAHFSDASQRLSLFYRRRNSSGGYRHVMMELLPAEDFSPSNQSLFLYVKDISRQND